MVERHGHHGGADEPGGNPPYRRLRDRPLFDTGTVYVGGSKGEAYWMRWGDFSGTIEGHEEGVVGNKPVVYEIDLSQAPTAGSDTG